MAARLPSIAFLTDRVKSVMRKGSPRKKWPPLALLPGDVLEEGQTRLKPNFIAYQVYWVWSGLVTWVWSRLMIWVDDMGVVWAGEMGVVWDGTTVTGIGMYKHGTLSSCFIETGSILICWKHPYITAGRTVN